jgi:hypothetical protein
MDRAWLTFWTWALIVAGAGFAGITLIVAVRGGVELVQLLKGGTHGVRKLKQ